ncbi:MAG: extracellular solute-binding protein [Burkholderiales bacterium]|jgi:putative spermidine/putrescine transport system substrate-binding protein|nr:extracellular solute-binding protein [Burkholderiales bacterium]
MIRPVVSSLLLIACAATAHAAPELVIVNFGGANGAAQRKAFYEPFERTSGAKVVAVEYNGEQARVKAMVEARKVTWDVVEVESPDLSRGCDEGLYERVDWSKLGGKAAYLPAAVHDCGVGAFMWSTVMAYDTSRFPGGGPKTWADFWDVKRFPGKRGLRKGARYALEFALLADGVKPADVYKVLATRDGADRAFRRLTELAPHLQWWEAGAQPVQWLVANDVAITSAYNGRIDAARREGRPLAVVWAGSLYDFDYWAVPKGSPNRDLALRYIATAGVPDHQAAFARLMPYGPTVPQAVARIDAETLKHLPSTPANMTDALKFDARFWADQGEVLEKRFAAWAAR